MAKVDDKAQYGVWGADGIRQRSASFAAMEQEWEPQVGFRRHKDGTCLFLVRSDAARDAARDAALLPTRVPPSCSSAPEIWKIKLPSSVCDLAVQVSAVWEAAGASEVAVQRLLIQGAKWQKGALGRV